jgi:hypothetical protein
MLHKELEVLSTLMVLPFAIGGFSCSRIRFGKSILYRVIEGHASITPLSRSEHASKVVNHGGAGLLLSG